MNFEEFGDILSAHIQLNAVKVLGWRFLIKLDNYPKHTAKATQQRRQIYLNGPVSHLFLLSRPSGHQKYGLKCRQHTEARRKSEGNTFFTESEGSNSVTKPTHEEILPKELELTTIKITVN